MDEHDSDAWAVNDTRLKVMEWSHARLGCFYRWGGRGEVLPASSWQDAGLEPPPCRELWDCSGFVLGAMVFAKLVPPDWLHNYYADRLFHSLEEISFAGVAPGDLAFWGRPAEKGNPRARSTHTMFLAGDGTVVGACGGNESTLTLETAYRAAAKVRVRPSHLYRSDFLGFRRLPNADNTQPKEQTNA